MILPLLLATTLAQAPDVARIVHGTVRDERGAPIAGARIHLEVCNGPHVVGVLAAELRHEPLPRARSTTNGTFTLVMAPAHDLFDWEVHGQLALVVEVEGRQPWRELLPSPVRLYDGSDVVLPPLRAADRATILAPGAPAGALVLLRRTARTDFLQQGGPPPGERYLLEVPAGGELEVAVPLLPNPATVPTTSYFAVTGWTAQLLWPGMTTRPFALAPGQKLELPRGAPPAPRPVMDTGGTRHRISRSLRRLADDTLRWFSSADGELVDDPLLPTVAVELRDAPHAGLVLTFDRVVAVPGPAPRELRFVTPGGELVRDVKLDRYAPADLVWAKVGSPRPFAPALERFEATGGTFTVPAELGERVSAWITAPGHAPRLCLDLRALPTDGRIELQPAPRTVTVFAADPAGNPIEGVRLFAGPASTIPGTTTSTTDGVWLTAAGIVPRTDANGRCVLPTTADWPHVHGIAPNYRFDWPEFDQAKSTLRLIGHPVRLFTARAVEKNGTPVPFANLGYEVWTFAADGSSSGTSFTAMADSRGLVRMFGDAKKPPRVRPGEMGHYPQGGTALVAAAITDVVTPRESIVALQTPATSDWGHYVMGWRGVGRARSGATVLAPHDGHALLMRWPHALPLWAHDVDAGPPVALTRDDAEALPLHVVDRTTVQRRTPLRLTGAVPHDLEPLRSLAAAVAGHEVPTWAPLRCEYLGTERGAASLTLSTRDPYAHDVWLLHPDVLPTKVHIPAGPAGREPLTAEFVPGAACTIVIKLPQPLRKDQGLHLIVSRPGVFRRPAYLGLLTDRRLYGVAATTGIELRAPFALPSGKLRLEVGNSGVGGGDFAPVEVTVEGTAPVRVEFVPR